MGQRIWFQLADTPQAAVEQADMVFTCVGNDNDLRE
jgi:3-hydroxyisobutyrate dehydrogenase-like beta-hydroxyacid dehydrogenase